MRLVALLMAGSLLLGCARGESDSEPNQTAKAQGPAGRPAAERDSGWDLRSGREGVELVLRPGADAAIRLVCPAGERRLLVNVPAFRPVGSEERLSFGSGGEVVALVADTRGDPERGGVSGAGPIPDNLAALLSGPVAANYGAQNSGPHQAPPAQLTRAFVAACGMRGSPGTPGPSPKGREAVSACLIQEGRRIPENRIKAIGTEPFWGAQIQGRCVTYSTPDDIEGTRVWTTFTGTSERGTWSGYLDDQRFVLRTRPEPGCSDGMSDERYPIAVTLTVRGEQRTGCAERL